MTARLGAAVRVGLVGAGRQGRTHGRALTQVDGARLVAVVDPDPVAARAAAAEWNLPDAAVHASLPEAAGCGAQAWIIATPPTAHLGNLTDLVDMPVPPAAVLCEKPAAWSLPDVTQMVRLARRTRVHLRFGVHLPYAVPHEVWSVLDRGGLGTLAHAEGQWLREDGAPGWGHFRDPSAPGATFDLAPHLLAVMLPWLRWDTPVRAVAAKMVLPGAGPVPDGLVPDDGPAPGGPAPGGPAPGGPVPADGLVPRDCAAQVELFRRSAGDHDLAGRLSVAWSGGGGGAGLRVRLEGTQATVTVRLDETGADPTVTVRLEGRSARARGQARTWRTTVRQCYRRQVAALVQAAGAGPAPRLLPGTGPACAAASTRVILAAYRSATQGGELVPC